MPNHACATGAQHDQYHVIRGSGDVVAQVAANPRLVIDMREHIAFVNTNKLTRPGGHYSHAVRFGDLVFVSGQLGIRPDGSHTAHLPFEDQVQQALENVLTALRLAGATAADVLKVTAYIVDVERWPRFNALYVSLTMYVSLTQPHLPTEPNRALKGKTGNGSRAEIPAEMDPNFGQLLDAVSTKKYPRIPMETTDPYSSPARCLCRSARQTLRSGISPRRAGPAMLRFGASRPLQAGLGSSNLSGSAISEKADRVSDRR